MQNPVNRIEDMDFDAYDQIKLTRQYYRLLRDVLGLGETGQGRLR